MGAGVLETSRRSAMVAAAGSSSCSGEESGFGSGSGSVSATGLVVSGSASAFAGSEATTVAGITAGSDLADLRFSFASRFSSALRAFSSSLSCSALY